MLKGRHGSPFEGGYLSVYVEAPVVVWWEWSRHRFMSMGCPDLGFNLESGRYRLLDGVDVIAPKAERKVIGLRATEKIHESMISEDESEWADERDGHYVIDPMKRVGKRFDYNSGSNHWRVSKEELRKDYESWLSAHS